MYLVPSYRLLIEYIQDKNDSAGKWKGYVYAGSMFVAATIESLILQQYFHLMMTTGMRVRSAVIGMVYEKVRKELICNLP